MAMKLVDGNVDSMRKPCSSEIEVLRKELNDYKQTNIELLEDKRLLLLRSQEAQKLEHELRRRRELQQMKCQLNELRSPQQLNGAEITFDANQKIIHHLFENSAAEEENLIDLDHKVESAEVFGKISEPREHIKDVRKKLTLPLRKKMEQDQERICCCGAAEKYAEVVKINHYWQKDYTALQDEYKLLKARLWKTEHEHEHLLQENKDIRDKTDFLEKRHSVNETNNHASFTLDDIEALKQQLSIYKEDYDAEKEDNKRITVEQNKLKLELQKAYAIIDNLTLKNSTIKENYRRVSHEKEKIIMELRRLSTSSLPLSPITNERTLGPRIPSNETLEGLRTEDVVPHSGGVFNYHTPPSFRKNGNVVRDGPIREKSFSFDDIHNGRTSPPTNHRRASSQPTNHFRGSSPPTKHIDYKEISSVM